MNRELIQNRPLYFFRLFFFRHNSKKKGLRIKMRSLSVVRFTPHIGAGCTPPLVLLHGLGGSQRVWDAIIARFGPYRSIVCPDLLGFGDSPKPSGLAYDVEDHITALERALARELARDFEIVGHSLGGVIAIELAARYSARCVAVSVISMPYFASAAEAERILVRRWMGRLLLRHTRVGRAMCFVICQHSHVWRPMLRAAAGRDVPHAVVDDSTKHTFESFSRSLRACIIDHRVDNAVAHLFGSHTPVYVYHGSADDTVPVAQAHAFAARFPDIRLEIVPGASHVAPLLSKLEWADRLPVCHCKSCTCPGH
jgi:pimeloyl-ACP methyl ester carboxylesterase